MSGTPARGRERPRVGVIGCGAVAAYGHLPALERLGHRPAVLVDPRLDFARALASRFGVPRVAADLAEVTPDLDAAIVAAPPALHADLSLPLLAAGIPVLVEKPLALHAADARRMVETAAASGARLAVSRQRPDASRIVRHRKPLPNMGAGASQGGARRRRVASCGSQQTASAAAGISSRLVRGFRRRFAVVSPSFCCRRGAVAHDQPFPRKLRRPDVRRVLLEHRRRHLSAAEAARRRPVEGRTGIG